MQYDSCTLPQLWSAIKPASCFCLGLSIRAFLLYQRAAAAADCDLSAGVFHAVTAQRSHQPTLYSHPHPLLLYIYITQLICLTTQYSLLNRAGGIVHFLSYKPNPPFCTHRSAVWVVSVSPAGIETRKVPVLRMSSWLLWFLAQDAVIFYKQQNRCSGTWDCSKNVMCSPFKKRLKKRSAVSVYDNHFGMTSACLPSLLHAPL